MTEEATPLYQILVLHSSLRCRYHHHLLDNFIRFKEELPSVANVRTTKSGVIVEAGVLVVVQQLLGLRCDKKIRSTVIDYHLKVQ